MQLLVFAKIFQMAQSLFTFIPHLPSPTELQMDKPRFWGKDVQGLRVSDVLRLLGISVHKEDPTQNFDPWKNIP